MKNYISITNKIGKKLFMEAVRWSREGTPDTKKARLEAVQAIKGRKRMPTKKMEAETAEYMANLSTEMRTARRSHRADRRDITPAPIVERVKLRRERLILEGSIRQRDSYSGETMTTILTGKPNAYTTTSAGDQYSRSCKYRMTDAEHVITVPSDWYRSVYKRGLARIDGMMTLSAEPVDADGYTVYRAVWIRSKGKQLTAQHGYIAIDPEHGAAHAATEAAAKGLLTRRANEARLARHEAKIRADLQDMHLNGYASITVTIGDSIAAGNCKPGTFEFRDRHFPGRDSATVEEVLGVDSMRSMAINACLRAIRRAKASHQEAA